MISSEPSIAERHRTHRRVVLLSNVIRSLRFSPTTAASDRSCRPLLHLQVSRPTRTPPRCCWLRARYINLFLRSFSIISLSIQCLISYRVRGGCHPPLASSMVPVSSFPILNDWRTTSCCEFSPSCRRHIWPSAVVSAGVGTSWPGILNCGRLFIYREKIYPPIEHSRWEFGNSKWCGIRCISWRLANYFLAF